MNAHDATLAELPKKLQQWLTRPGTVITPAEIAFIHAMRASAAEGVGYGWMQQVIEWEWQEKGVGAWGPESFEAELLDNLKSRK